MSKVYDKLVAHYENCLEKHGDNHLGVDWPNPEDADKRYKVMLDIIRVNNDAANSVSLLDFGCGTGHLFEYSRLQGINNIKYAGLDISRKFVDLAREKYPDSTFYCLDVLEAGDALPAFDYVVMNGVFTEKRELTFEAMWDYFTKMIPVIYEKSNKGFAFNVMSKNVDWERDDLFHVPCDLLSGYLCRQVTRKFIIRNDYGLYEYTVYVFK